MSDYAFLFPGQGAQVPGMGRALAERYPESREVFETADRALESAISEICFGASAETLALTENTQPAILTTSVAALRALESRGMRPAAAAGHSLGEYSALVAAGSLEFPAAVRCVRSRGRFMQEAVKVGEGAMAAILGLDADHLARICAEAAEDQVLAPANFNAPGQVVVAGHAEAVVRAVEKVRQSRAGRAVLLDVSAPFHCSLMRAAAERLHPLLERMEFGRLAFPVYTNVDAAAVQSGADAREALKRQVASPVRWHESMAAMIRSGVTRFVEIGPGRVLGNLARRIDPAVEVFHVSDPQGVEAAAAKLGGAS